MQRWLTTEATSGGPPVRVVLPAGRCRRWWPVVQNVTGVSVAQLPLGLDPLGAGVVVQSFGAADLATIATHGLPVADDRVAIDVSIQGGAGASLAVIADDGCC
jgi:hypothetical protein